MPDTNGVTKSGRAQTNRVGGDQVTIGVTEKDPQITLTHEFGHVAGAGDQYAGGIAVEGSILTSDVPGEPNIMKNLKDVNANDQSLREIISLKSNLNSCAPRVHAPNGGC